MCSIYASPDFEKFKELHQLNLYRGGVSHSFVSFRQQSEDMFTLGGGMFKGSGVWDSSSVESHIPNQSYFIGHQQAPTTQSELKSAIHPSISIRSYLWHNGIIKDYYVKEMQEAFGSTDTWDTGLLHRLIETRGIAALSKVDGSFACAEYDLRTGRIYFFRNALSPLFYSEDGSVSSTKFDGSTRLPAGKVFLLYNNKLVQIEGAEFETAFNPYDI